MPILFLSTLKSAFYFEPLGGRISHLAKKNKSNSSVWLFKSEMMDARVSGDQASDAECEVLKHNE